MSTAADRCEHSFPDPYPQPMTRLGDCRGCGISYQEAREEQPSGGDTDGDQT